MALEAKDNWMDGDPWIDFNIVGVSRDRKVRLAVVKALRTMSQVSLADLPPSIEEHIANEYGLSGELAELGLALHIANLKRVQAGKPLWPGKGIGNG